VYALAEEGLLLRACAPSALCGAGGAEGPGAALGPPEGLRPRRDARRPEPAGPAAVLSRSWRREPGLGRACLSRGSSWLCAAAPLSAYSASDAARAACCRWVESASAARALTAAGPAAAAHVRWPARCAACMQGSDARVRRAQAGRACTPRGCSRRAGWRPWRPCTPPSCRARRRGCRRPARSRSAATTRRRASRGARSARPCRRKQGGGYRVSNSGAHQPRYGAGTARLR